MPTDGSSRVWDKCATTTSTSFPIYYQSSVLGCICKPEWEYHGSTYQGCAITGDSFSPWCFAINGAACLEAGGSSSWSLPGEVWDTCNWVPTDHGCHCNTTWIYDNVVRNGCVETDDHDYAWCYVSDGEECAGAVKTHKDGFYWDTCKGAPTTTLASSNGIAASTASSTASTESFQGTSSSNGCRCKAQWTYLGVENEGCAASADHDDSWCLVEDQEACLAAGGQRSVSNPGEVWDNCIQGGLTDNGCRCNIDFPPVAVAHGGCEETPDHDTPWCFVQSQLGKCSGSVKTSKTGRYWDTCVDLMSASPSSPSLVRRLPLSEWGFGTTTQAP